MIARPTGAVLCLTLAGMACGLLAGLALAEDACRIAFDMGSSGIRAGASSSPTLAHSEFDYLAEWWAKHSLAGAADTTTAALRELPRRAGFPQDCQPMGGGFSAWRLAAEANGGALADTLERIHKASGVPVLVIPQRQEGAYGYFGSRQLLGKRLTTSHVLDIGGGSLQISGEQSSYGDALGQKIWQRLLCEKIRQTAATPCVLQPLSERELTTARTLLDERLKPVSASLPGTVSMTAISRPVSRGVFPMLKKLAAENADPRGFSLATLSLAIDRLARTSQEDTALLAANKPAYVKYLLSDMLLVEGLLRATGGSYLHVAEIELTNIPGLLDDARAFAWGKHYACYLDRLRQVGLNAYDSEIASCPP